MIKLTKAVLRRPVTTLLVVLSIVFFGVISITNTRMELTPEINMPMVIITTTYSGAAPEDINELVTKPIENSCSTLGHVRAMTSMSYENYGMTMITYEYGTDMDNAYSDLRKKLDLAKASLPEDASDPLIIEMNIDQLASMYISVTNSAVNNIYNYTETNIIPEIEKLSPVASASMSGGAEDYISIQLIPEKVSQYRLDINTIASLVGSASYSMPAGNTGVGNTDMTLSSGVDFDTVDSLKKIPLTTGNGSLIYLEDVAVVARKQKTKKSIGRYNGEDTVLISVERNQQYTSVDVSNDVRAAIRSLEAADPNLKFIIVEDSADQIKDSLNTMLKTLAIAVAISTVILLLFYGDLKASLIVATSIPLALLAGFILIWGMGYSMNVITLGSLVLAVGMMVDNSIVVLESCFRVMEENPDTTFHGYIRSAVRGTEVVGASIFGSTLTTCVVFLPLAFTEGLSSQFFEPMAWTIVFCMIASLLSAVTIVPLCFVFYKPVEKEKAPAYHLIRSMQNGYRRLMKKLLKARKRVIGAAVFLFFFSIFLATRLQVMLMPEIDQGSVTISVSTKPDLTIEEKAEVIQKIENIIVQDEDLENYSSSSGSVNCYLRSDRKKTTKETVKKWRRELQAVDNCDISVAMNSYTSVMNSGPGFSVTLQNSSYDRLYQSTKAMKDALMQDGRVTGVSSTMDNSSPILKIHIDPVAAAAEGLVPAQVSASLYSMMKGREAKTMDVDGLELSVMVEYPADEFDDLQKIENTTFRSMTGATVFLRDIAEVSYEDSPAYIQRTDKQYICELRASYTDLADRHTASDLTEKYIQPNLTGGTKTVQAAMDKMMDEEFNSLYIAIAIAIFLIFVVMAAQFESPRFSIMVMSTIPFAMVGSFGFLWLFNVPLTMPALVGFIMLIGTVVNNGILYVDTVNQYRSGKFNDADPGQEAEKGMELEEALIEAGTVRLRPILMTTLTTVLSMMPMVLKGDGAGALMQGLAMTEAGGLITSTVMALLVLPAYYYVVNGKKDVRKDFAELQ